LVKKLVKERVRIMKAKSKKKTSKPRTLELGFQPYDLLLNLDPDWKRFDVRLNRRLNIHGTVFF